MIYTYAMETAKPFLKWAGGKTQLLKEIKKYYPGNFTKYCEPFVGGGAVLFDVLINFEPKEILINDINTELINCYDKIKNNVFELIEVLSGWQEQYLKSNFEEREKIFYVKRNRFNNLIQTESESVEKAALMIYLNKTCFNGLYRVNSKGLFNVPYGKYKNPGICQPENLLAVSKTLQNVIITAGNYSSTEDFIDSDTFVYIDPPYRPLTQSSSFTSYSKEGFCDKEQIELSNFVKKIRQKGAKILLSNSDPKNINISDDFFDNLYKDYDIHRVSASRMINSNAHGRGRIKEILVSSFS